MDHEYVKNTVGPSLVDAMSMVGKMRPEDPIDFLSQYLKHTIIQADIKLRREAEEAERMRMRQKLAEEEEKQRLIDEEKRRLEELKRPNDAQLECIRVLDRFAQIRKDVEEQGTSMTAMGENAIGLLIKDLADQEVSVHSLQEKPPEPLVQLLQGGLVMCGYPKAVVKDWQAIASLLAHKHFFRRLETLDMQKPTPVVLRRALACVAGVDYQARNIQKHALGPIATRFHQIIVSALDWGQFSSAAFAEDRTIVDLDQETTRLVWTSAEAVAAAIPVDDEELQQEDMPSLSTLAQLDTVALPTNMTSQPATLKVMWELEEGATTDVDVSIIVLNNHGQLYDSVYHLVHHTKDGNIKLQHSAKEATEQSYQINFDALNEDNAVLAVVINTANDGESLEYVRRCNMELTSAESTVAADTAEAATAAPPYAHCTISTKLLTGHEILMGLISRDEKDGQKWTLNMVGQLVQGLQREATESQNFLNALPLAQQFVEELGIRAVVPSQAHVVHPFQMVPGDKLLVPENAMHTKVVIGMGWDVDDEISMDLDCGLAVYSSGERTDYCDFEKLVSNDQAIEHQGDNRDGEGDGDDESIVIEFDKLDPKTDTLFLYAAVYEGGALKDVLNVHIRMLSQKDGKQKEICRYSLDWLESCGDSTAVILAKIYREGDNWVFGTLGATTNGRTIEELEGKLTEHLGDFDPATINTARRQSMSKRASSLGDEDALVVAAREAERRRSSRSRRKSKDSIEILE
eukprot:m.124764 g.124764  ORF g.124764 m.124764 type:complete len:746 (+) comp13784_c0_seq1:356-2593(+)